jgi:hypothetical protein
MFFLMIVSAVIMITLAAISAISSIIGFIYYKNPLCGIGWIIATLFFVLEIVKYYKKIKEE